MPVDLRKLEKNFGDISVDTLTADGALQNNSGTYFEGVSTSTTVSGATDIDLNTSNLFRHTVTDNTTYSFVGESAELGGASFTLLIEMGDDDYTIDWPDSVEWDSAEAPTTPPSGESLEVSFITYDGGTTWKGRPSWSSN